jgi:hypothetical protein
VPNSWLLPHKPNDGWTVQESGSETWRSSFLGLGIMIAASLLWSIISVLVLGSVGILHVNALIKAVLILCLTCVPSSVLVGSTLGYWIASTRPSPIGAAAIAAVAAVTINALFVSFAIQWWSTASSSWAGATAGGAVLGLTAAPFWFVGTLVLYGFVERRLLGHTHRDNERTESLSALITFFLNPSTSATKLANPLTWACYLFVYDLFLSLLLGFFVVVPLRRYFGASFIGEPAPRWTLIILLSIIEELIFRLPLRYTAINLNIAALLFALFAIRSLLFRFGIFGFVTFTERWLWSAVLALLIASVVFVLLRTQPVKRIISRIWLHHFRSVLYFSCVAFGLAHVYNFTSITVASLLLAPRLVLPQVISGFIFAFARMRLGMIWCIVLHTAHNVLFFFMGPVRPRW